MYGGDGNYSETADGALDARDDAEVVTGCFVDKIGGNRRIIAFDIAFDNSIKRVVELRGREGGGKKRPKKHGRFYRQSR